MSSTGQTIVQNDQRAALPWRAAGGIVLALLLTGAVYLYAVRWPMLLLDLATGMGGMFCL